MAVAFDVAANNRGTGTSITVSMTLGASANFLVAFTMVDAGANFNPTATWNGVSMGAHVEEITTNKYLARFQMVDPDTGTHDLVISGLPGGGEEQAYGVSFSGVDTASPTDAAQTGSASSGGDLTLTVDSEVGDMVLSCATTNGGTPPSPHSSDDPAITVPANGSITDSDMSSAIGYQAGQTSVVAAWTIADSHSRIAFNINAAAAGLGIPIAMYHYQRMQRT